ncbi:metallophosphoesterase [Paenibacillus qinlingensis]|uniref:metallophosphoesterase n=1 Tax=Paenibacillus qinlingensis TaxID=1837343 RepID=UPI001FE8158D|nr:metallophosphoesterase [Paenibacillus qinlingensis]
MLYNCDMENKEKITRRSFLKKSLLLGGSLLAVPPLSYGYATRVEPRWLQVERISLAFATLPETFKGLRIVQFSDLHFGFHLDVGQLTKVVKVIQAEKPDIVCFTGDLVDYEIGGQGQEIRDVLKTITATYGCYAVLGNHDYYGDVDEVADVLEGGGFHCLRNRGLRIQKDSQSIWIAGVEDMWEGVPNLKTALQSAKKEEWVLLLSHAPDYADVVAAVGGVHLQLSGHSHGGQVRLPIIGPLASVPFGVKYPSGLYHIGNGKQLTLYTNRGIGVSVRPIRFMCRPEITVLTLVKG